MNNLQKRYLMFLLGCIPTRLGFALLAKYIPTKYLPYLGILALIPAAGFLYIYFFNKRKTGAEVFGSKIWWNPLRIVHAFIYITFAIYAIQKKDYAYIPLIFDVIIGLISFLIYHNFVS